MLADIISTSIATLSGETNFFTSSSSISSNSAANRDSGNKWRISAALTSMPYIGDLNKSNGIGYSNHNRQYSSDFIDVRNASVSSSISSISTSGNLAEFPYNETTTNSIVNFTTSDDLYNSYNNNNYNNYTTFSNDQIDAAIDEMTMGAMRNEDFVVLLKTIFMSIVLVLMILITIIGNVFVIAAIILERNLQSVANYLVASLAVADLFVACLVMPLGAVYEISEGWILGPELCDIWTSCDVLCCTASILHLVAIAADRYWTVTNIDYNNLRTPGRVFFMIFCVWFAALIVSLAPQFGWKDPEYMQRIEEQKCMVSQDVAYQIFATCCTFYVPLLVILVLYWKIYKIARKRIQRHKKRHAAYGSTAQSNQSQADSTDEPPKRRKLKIGFGKTEKDSQENTSEKEQQANGQNEIAPATKDCITIPQVETEFSTSNFDSKSHAGTELTTVSSDADESRQSGIDEITTVSHHVATAAYQQHAIAITLTTPQLNLLTITTAGTGGNKAASGGGGGKGISRHLPFTAAAMLSTNPHQKLAKRRQMLEAKRERKAAQTLAIITGAFAVCWLPFFVMALLQPLCKSCDINEAIASLFLWLGYFNSTLNPIIYTIFNPEFRRAFKRILCGRNHATLRARSGKI